MNMITQEAKKKQAVVEYALKYGKSAASRKYGVSLSSVKRWCKDMTGRGSHWLRNPIDRTAIRTNIRRRKKSRYGIRFENATPDTAGMACTAICREKDIPEVFPVWFMTPSEWDSLHRPRQSEKAEHIEDIPKYLCREKKYKLTSKKCRITVCGAQYCGIISICINGRQLMNARECGLYMGLRSIRPRIR